MSLKENMKKLGWTGENATINGKSYIRNIKCSCGGDVRCMAVIHTGADIAYCQSCGKEMRCLGDSWTITNNIAKKKYIK